MSFPVRFIVPSLCLSLVCLSCRKEQEDPQLLVQRDQQKSEITRLRSELAVLEEKLRNLPPDVTKELEDVAKQAEQQGAEVAKLEAEAADLKSRKRALQKEFDTYRAKYPIP